MTTGFIGASRVTDVTVRQGDRIVWEGGHYAAGDPGMISATAGEPEGTPWGGITVRVGSGNYSFVLTRRHWTA